MIKRSFVLGTVLAALLLSISLSPVTVRAAPILDFDIAAPTAGTISYAGGANPLIGSGITVDTVVGLGTPLNDGVVIPLPGALLNFTTGNFIGGDPLHWNFAGGGTISMSFGSITLLSGTFSDAIVTNTDDDFRVAVAGFFDTKDPALTSFYGLPNSGYEGDLNISFMASGVVPSAFASSMVLSGDVANTPVPEPGTLLLLGFGLIGIAWYGRKKLT